MHTGLLHLHSALRWVAVLLMVICLIDNLVRMYKPFNKQDNKLALFTLISMHLQLLIGLALWGMYLSATLKANAEIMKDSVNRFYLVEHFIGMVLAIVFVTVGYSKAKKQTEKWAKHRMLFFYYLVAFILMMVSIPWPFRAIAESRGWF
jgi:hypothetical protein